MIDQRGTKTMQLINWPRPPGRPKKHGGAMTGAERMRKYREKQARERKEEENQNQEEKEKAKERMKKNRDESLVDDMHEGLTRDPDDVTRAKAAWLEYGRRMGWL